jgi:hypothetical protein
MQEEMFRTTIELPASLMTDIKLILTKKHGNPHGHWNKLVVELLKEWVDKNKKQ